MKVRELIEKLQAMPQDAEVFSYCWDSEDDSPVSKVEICHRDNEYRWQMQEYYCQADSYAAQYLEDNKNETQVVVIQG